MPSLPLLDRAAGEFWSPERRLLHDLQNVCLDHEREVFRLEPVGWIMSLGRRPLRHPLPHLREVTMSRHLRSAARRLRRVRLPARRAEQLEGLLRAAVDNAEEALRQRFRPWVDSTLESIWVRPANLPERVAYRKLVEEMLDPIESRGFTTLGDLRDAASRSNLKLQDLAGAGEFLRGDRLLQADKALGEVLDGVHRRGEVYLRWLQRFSALAFGTSAGRFLTLYLALPFGGSFVLLKGLEEINEVVMIARFTDTHIHLTSVREHPAAGHGGPGNHQLRSISPSVSRAARLDRPGSSSGAFRLAFKAGQSSPGAAALRQQAGDPGLAVRAQAGPGGRAFSGRLARLAGHGPQAANAPVWPHFWRRRCSSTPAPGRSSKRWPSSRYRTPGTG